MWENGRVRKRQSGKMAWWENDIGKMGQIRFIALVTVERLSIVTWPLKVCDIDMSMSMIYYINVIHNIYIISLFSKFSNFSFKVIRMCFWSHCCFGTPSLLFNYWSVRLGSTLMGGCVFRSNLP